jgi:hypothetical protein
LQDLGSLSMLRMRAADTGMAQLFAEQCFSLLKPAAAGILAHCRAVITDAERLWWPHYGFSATPLDLGWIEHEPALCAVQQVSPISQLGILKMPDRYMYHWHRDQNRLACINLLLSVEHHSHTLFGEPVDQLNMHCLELQYRPGRYYLFNNQVPHAVINLDADRYLLSLEFQQAVAYPDLRCLLQKADLLVESSGS